MLAGDFNAYAKETPITTILDGGYVSVKDLGKVDPPEYSYVFNAQWGTLDYIFMRESFFSDSLAEAAAWAVNADELDYLDYNLDFGRDLSVFDGTTPFRFSDHDPIVLNFQLEKREASLDEMEESSMMGKKSKKSHLSSSGKKGKKRALRKRNMVKDGEN
jgi:predicted extracellular nuclease